MKKQQSACAKTKTQIGSNCEADQRLCFCYTDSTIIRNFKPLACFSVCTGRFVSDLVRILKFKLLVLSRTGSIIKALRKCVYKTKKICPGNMYIPWTYFVMYPLQV